MSLIYCLFAKSLSPISVKLLPSILWIGGVCNGIAYLLWGLALNIGDTTKVSLLAYLTPFCALIFGYILLKESISLISLLGLILIVGGILIQTILDK